MKRILRTIRDKVRPCPSPTVRSIETRTFAVFKLDDGSAVELLDGYRDRMKGRWRRLWWPSRALLELDDHALLFGNAKTVANEIRASRSLPYPPSDLAPIALEAASSHPELLKPINEPLNGIPGQSLRALEPVPKKMVDYYRNSASRIVNGTGLEPSDLDGLEIGCGTGYMSLAMASLGVRATGIDRDTNRFDREQRSIAAEQFGASAEFIENEAETLPFEDASFNFVHSSSVLEHVERPSEVFAETYRVLKPGGLAFHSVDPWFHPAGGHTLCTLDFPWGHVRLSRSEFVRYMEEFRPHELARAIEFYDQYFQNPRLSGSEIMEQIVASGFEINRLDSLPTRFTEHLPIIGETVIDQVKRNYPSVAMSDLVTRGYNFMLRKPT